MLGRMPICMLLAVVLGASSARLRAAAAESKEMAAVREQMQQRPRRIIYNNDGCDVYAPAADTPSGFLAQRMQAVPGSQVDSVFYCTGATVMFSHDARVGESYGRQPAGAEWAEYAGRNTQALLRQGTDTLRLVIDFCRRHDLEVFFTHRINDIHDSMESCNFELADWKREHPEYCLARQQDQSERNGRDPRFWWSALNFEIPEVRDYLAAIVADICRRYDIDGYEIDYFRSPVFFPPTLDGRPVTRKQMDILTGFQQRLRKIAYREGNRRGRPLLMAVRVPMTVEKCRMVGIDIERWLRADLFDVLTTGGGYVPFTMPTAELVTLGHRYGKPVYPTISASGLRGRFRSTAAWRGVAANAWAAAADGLVLFNTFPKAPGHPHFTELGDPDGLRYRPKVFAVDNHPVVEGDLAHAIEQEGILPVPVTAQRTVRVELPVADDVAAAAAAGRLKSLTMHVGATGPAAAEPLQLRLNGRRVAWRDPQRRAYTVPGRFGRAFQFTGTNILSAGADESLQIADTDFSFSLWVRTTQKQDWSGLVVFVKIADQRPGVKLYWNAGTLNISLRTAAAQRDWDVGGGERLLDGQWHHYAATFDRDGSALAYVDGDLVGTCDISELAGTLGLGKTLLLGTGDVPFEGALDDVRLYGRVLTGAEVDRLAAADSPDVTVATEQLLGRWRFDEPRGLRFADASGNSNPLGLYRSGEVAWFVYEPEPGQLRQGLNRVQLRAAAGEGQVTSLELDVRYNEP